MAISTLLTSHLVSGSMEVAILWLRGVTRIIASLPLAYTNGHGGIDVRV